MTVDELVALWEARDNRYSMRRVNRLAHPLSLAEEAIIRTWRDREIRLLPPGQQAAAWIVLRMWQPPIPWVGR